MTVHPLISKCRGVAKKATLAIMAMLVWRWGGSHNRNLGTWSLIVRALCLEV